MNFFFINKAAPVAYHAAAPAAYHAAPVGKLQKQSLYSQQLTNLNLIFV